VRFDPLPHVKLGGIVRGECWLALQGHGPALLREGDFYLLGNPPPYVLASALSEEPRDAKSLWDSAANGAVRIGPEAGEDTYLCGGHFSFDDTNASILIDVLPPHDRYRRRKDERREQEQRARPISSRPGGCDQESDSRKSVMSAASSSGSSIAAK
jgi:hypothetical protein